MSTSWNPSDKAAAITLSGSNQVATGGAGGDAGVRSVHSFTTEKIYFEVQTGSLSDFHLAAGVASAAWNTASGSAAFGIPPNGIGKYATASYIDYNGTQYDNPNVPTYFSSGNRIAYAFDGANARVAVNIFTGGSWSGWRGNGAADPVAGTNMVDVSATLGSAVVKYLAAVLGNGDNCTLRSATAEWTGTCPSGYGEINSVGPPLEQAWQSNAFLWFPQATGGSVVYDVDITESIGTIAETVTAQASFASSVTESIGTIADAVSSQATFASAVTESVGTIADSSSNTGTFNHAVTESVGTIAESSSNTGSFNHAVTESIGTIADASTGAATFQVSISEAVGTIADSTAAGLSYLATITESIGTIADTASGAATFAASLTENIGSISDSQSSQATFASAVTESVGTIAESQSSQATFQSSVTESVGTIAETQAGPLTMPAAVSESIGTISDAQSAQATMGAAVTETIGAISDSVAVAGATYNVTVSESMTFTDQTTGTGGGGLTAAYELGGDTQTERFTPPGTLQQPDYLSKKTRGS